MKTKGLRGLSTLMAMAVAALLLTACEDEPEQTQERLDEAIGQKEVQDLVRDDDDPDAPRRDEEEELEEREER
jgi:(p)ppGpp synthase/HD superfamily hydrolase